MNPINVSAIVCPRQVSISFAFNPTTVILLAAQMTQFEVMFSLFGADFIQNFIYVSNINKLDKEMDEKRVKPIECRLGSSIMHESTREPSISLSSTSKGVNYRNQKMTFELRIAHENANRYQITF